MPSALRSVPADSGISVRRPYTFRDRQHVFSIPDCPWCVAFMCTHTSRPFLLKTPFAGWLHSVAALKTSNTVLKLRLLAAYLGSITVRSQSADRTIQHHHQSNILLEAAAGPYPSDPRPILACGAQSPASTAADFEFAVTGLPFLGWRNRGYNVPCVWGLSQDWEVLSKFRTLLARSWTSTELIAIV